MMELLSPAPSPEAALAAVQNGADAIYLGFSDLTGCREAVNFADAQFEKTVSYCRVRGCRVYLAMDVLVSDAEMPKAGGFCLRAQRAGVDAVIVRDLGLLRVLRGLLPEMRFFAASDLGFRTPDDARLAAAMGFSRIFLSPGLSAEEIAAMSGLGVELAVMVQGRICAAQSGLCSMSVLSGRGSRDRGGCTNRICREAFSLGGRWDTTPLSYKDRCLIRSLDALEESGVDCVYIGDRDRRAEYTAAFTAVYARAVHEKKLPARTDLEKLESFFSEYGFSQGMESAGEPAELKGKELEAYCSEVRKSYTGTAESRRVSVEFGVAAQGDHSRIRLGVIDQDRNMVVTDGPLPTCYGDVDLKVDALRDVLYKTAGTPYHCLSVQVRDGEGLMVSSSELAAARRTVLELLSAERARVEPKKEGSFAPAPRSSMAAEDPVFNFRFRTSEQMTKEMAAMKPALVYVPLELLSREPGVLEPFIEQGCTPVAVLPPIVSAGKEQRELELMLDKIRGRGVYQVLCSQFSQAIRAADRGFGVRAGSEMQTFNGYALQSLARSGFMSAVISEQLPFDRIRLMPKCLNTEMMIYGRQTAMVTEKCILKASAGRCTCTTPGQMADVRGGVWPVVREFGCRNTVYSSKKLFLADKAEDYRSCGLWAVQLSFTTESPRECLEVARSYMEGSGYRPNGLTRGSAYALL